MSSSSLPSAFPISTAAFLTGSTEKPFRRHVLALLERDDRERVTRESLERFLGREITSEMYWRADSRRSQARAYQREYSRRTQGAANAVA